MLTVTNARRRYLDNFSSTNGVTAADEVRLSAEPTMLAAARQCSFVVGFRAPDPFADFAASSPLSPVATELCSIIVGGPCPFTT